LFFTLDAKNGKKHNFLAEMKTITSQRLNGNEAMSGAKQNFVLRGLIVRLLENATHWHSHDISDRKILATDIEGVECVGASGAVFEEIFFGFGELLA
jgi:hypothetical protein